MPRDLRWVTEHSPDVIVDALAPYLTDARRARIEEVLSRRIGSLTLLLDDLYDGHNGAAVLRSAEGFGLTEVHVVEPRNPFRYTRGIALGADRWLEVRRHVDFPSAVTALRTAGFKIFAAHPDGAVPVDELDLSQPTALLLGNEHDGLSEQARAAADACFALPMYGFTQSYNLSVSAALALGAVVPRRRRLLPGTGDLAPDAINDLRARWYAASLRARTARELVALHVSRAPQNVDAPPRPV